MSTQDPEQSDELLAAELSFGLLDPDDRRDAEARQRHDSDFGRLCAIWLDRAAVLLDGPDVAPGADLWARIAARLPANDDRVVATLRGSLRRWRAVAAGLGMIALVLGATTLEERQRAHRITVASAKMASAVPIVVILTSADRHAIVSLSFDPASRRYSVASDAFQAGDHSAELWVIPSDNVPRSLGLIPPPRRAGLIAGGEVADRIAPGVTLAISLEPIGGSKTGKPTGPVVLTGRV